MTGKCTADKTINRAVHEKLVKDRTQSIRSIHPALISIFEKEVAYSWCCYACRQPSLINQRPWQDRLPTARTSGDPKKIGSVAVSPFAKSVVHEKPFTRSIYLLWIKIFVVFIVRREVSKKVSLLLVFVDPFGFLTTRIQNHPNSIKNASWSLHFLQLNIPILLKLFCIEVINVVTATVIQLIDFSFFFVPVVPMSHILPCTWELRSRKVAYDARLIFKDMGIEFG